PGSGVAWRRRSNAARNRRRCASRASRWRLPTSSRNPTAESHVVEFAAHGSQAGIDIAEAFTVSELSEGHRQILIPARQLSVVPIAVIARDALLELAVREMGDQLRENGPAGIHPPLFRRTGGRLSNRFRSFLVQIVFWPKAIYPNDAN